MYVRLVFTPNWERGESAFPDYPVHYWKSSMKTSSRENARRNLTAKHMWMITDVESFDIDFIKQSGCSKPRYSSVINSNLCPRYYFMFFIR